MCDMQSMIRLLCSSHMAIHLQALLQNPQRETASVWVVEARPISTTQHPLRLYTESLASPRAQSEWALGSARVLVAEAVMGVVACHPKCTLGLVHLSTSYLLLPNHYHLHIDLDHQVGTCCNIPNNHAIDDLSIVHRHHHQIAHEAVHLPLMLPGTADPIQLRKTNLPCDPIV